MMTRATTGQVRSSPRLPSGAMSAGPTEATDRPARRRRRALDLSAPVRAVSGVAAARPEPREPPLWMKRFSTT